jgi:class 3 adenylate cyclase
VLVDRATRDALSPTAFACGTEHAAELKGFDNRVPLYDVTRSG